MSSVFRTYKHEFSFRHNTQQSFFLHLLQSQFTQFHFRFSGLKILSWDSRTEKYEFRFPNLKIWEKFSGLKFWGSDLEKIQEKNQKVSKFQKSPKTFPSVKTCLGAIFLKKFFCSVFHGVIESLRKNQKNSKLQKSPKSFPKLSKFVLNMFCGNFFRKKLPRVTRRVGSSKNFKKIKKVSKFKKCPKSFPKVSKRVLNMFGAIFSNFFLPRGPCGAFQILWT